MKLYDSIHKAVQQKQFEGSPRYVLEKQKLDQTLELALSLDQTETDTDRNRGSVVTDRVELTYVEPENNDWRRTNGSYSLVSNIEEAGTETYTRWSIQTNGEVYAHRMHTTESDCGRKVDSKTFVLDTELGKFQDTSRRV